MKGLGKSRRMLRKPIFWHLSAIYPREKFTSDQKLHHNSLLYTLPVFLNIPSDMHHVEANRKRYIPDKAKISSKNSSFWTKIFGHFFVKNQKTIGQKYYEPIFWFRKRSVNINWLCEWESCDDDQRSPNNKKNIRTKMLSARLSTFLNLLNTTLIRCLCSAKDDVVKSGDIRQKTTMR